MSTRKNNKSSIVYTFLEFLNNLKLYHWNTRSYSEHKATDDLHEKLGEHIDKFVEILLSNTRLPNGKKTIVLLNTTHSNFVKKLNSFRKFLLSLILQPDLMNLRDELLADIDQFVYLLSQK